MAVSIPSHLNLQSSDVQVGEHAIVMRTARIVEWDLATISTRITKAIFEKKKKKSRPTLN